MGWTRYTNLWVPEGHAHVNDGLMLKTDGFVSWKTKKIPRINTKLAKIIYKMEAMMNSPSKTGSRIYVPTQTFSVK
jgi:hypothetical protein